MRLLPRKGFWRRHAEALLITLAAAILIERNVARSGVTSRKDNNEMWAMAWRLRDMAKRVRTNYKEADPHGR